MSGMFIGNTFHPYEHRTISNREMGRQSNRLLRRIDQDIGSSDCGSIFVDSASLPVLRAILKDALRAAVKAEACP